MNAGCKRLGVVKTETVGLFLADGSQLFEDEEVQEEEFVHEKVVFLGESPPDPTGKHFFFIAKASYASMFHVESLDGGIKE